MKKVFLLTNMKTLLATIIALTPVSAMADTYQEGYASSKTCYKQTYREEYVPGTKEDPGLFVSLMRLLKFHVKEI